METRRFTPEEMARLVAEAASWVRQQREKHYPLGQPLSETEKLELQPFFSAETLNRARIRDLSHTEETIPYPPFYDFVRAGGARVVPDAAHMTAMPFVDVALFNREPTLRTIFHNLIHLVQFEVVGVERFIRGYFKTLSEAGLWMVVPFEQQAYGLDARYTKDPADVFSVEEEVRAWLKAGRF